METTGQNKQDSRPDDNSPARGIKEREKKTEEKSAGYWTREI